MRFGVVLSFGYFFPLQGPAKALRSAPLGRVFEVEESCFNILAKFVRNENSCCTQMLTVQKFTGNTSLAVNSLELRILTAECRQGGKRTFLEVFARA